MLLERFRLERKTRHSLFVYVGVVFLYVAWRVFTTFGIEPRLGGDGVGYLSHSNDPIISILWAGERPLIIPLFFKVLGSNIYVIQFTQIAISIIAWLFFALVIVRQINNHAVAFSAFLIVLLFSIGQQLTHWDTIILSESLSLSLLVTMIGVILIMVNNISFRFAFFLLLASSAWMLTRDANSVIGLIVIATFIPWLIYRHLSRDLSFVYVALSIVGFLIALFNVISVANAGRADSAGPHMVVDRILPKQDRTAWFQNRGMPVTPALIESSVEYRRLRSQGMLTSEALANTLRSGDDYSEFWAWSRSEGLRQYIKYSLTHPIFGLFGPFLEPRNQPMILGQNQGYASLEFDNRLNPTVEMILFPSCDIKESPTSTRSCITSRSVVAALIWFLPLAGVVVGIFLFGITKNMTFTVAMLAVALMHGLLVWHGDSWEEDRHLFQLTVLLRVGVIMMVVFGMDSIVTRGRHSRTDEIGTTAT